MVSKVRVGERDGRKEKEGKTEERRKERKKKHTKLGKERTPPPTAARRTFKERRPFGRFIRSMTAAARGLSTTAESIEKSAAVMTTQGEIVARILSSVVPVRATTGLGRGSLGSLGS